MPATYTVKQVADILGYSTNSIYTFLKEKRIKGVRVGKGRFRIPHSELDRLLLTTKTKGGSSERKSQEVMPITTEIPSILQLAHPTGVVEPQHGYSPITGLVDGFGRRAIDVPSLFDWFLGIASIVLGLTLLLFSKSQEQSSVFRFMPWMMPVRISLILGGFGLLLTDIIGEIRSRWHIVFHAVLTAAFVAFTLFMFAIGDGDGVAIFGLLGLTIVVSYFLGMGGIASLSLYLWFLTLFPPFIYVLWPHDYHVPPLWLALAKINTGLFLAFWLVFSVLAGWLLWWGYHHKRVVFWILMGFAAVCLIGTSIWYAQDTFWNRAFFTLTLAVFTLFAPAWGAFRFAHKKDRRIVFSLFGYLLLLFVIGINVLWFMQGNVLEFASSQLLNKVNYGRIIVETSMSSVRGTLESASQNQLLHKALTEEDREVIDGILRGLYEGSKDMRRILIVSSSGDILSAYPFDEALTGQNIAYRDYFTNTFTAKKTYVSDIFESIGSSPRPVVAIATPFIDASGEVDGMIVGSLDLENLGDRLQQIVATRDGEYVTVVDAAGKRLIHPKKELVGTSVSQENPLMLGMRGEYGIGEWETVDGIRSLQAYDTIGLTRWGIAIYAPLSSILQPTRASSMVIFSVILVSVGLIGAFLLLYQARATRLPAA